jgi:hypothetical protein
LLLGYAIRDWELASKFDYIGINAGASGNRCSEQAQEPEVEAWRLRHHNLADWHK